MTEFISAEKQMFLKALKEKTDAPQVKELREAMEYSLMAESKRLRPLILLFSYDAFAGKNSKCESRETAVDFSCALEMIHSYSLIHDDLPAVDNDDYRRGKLTNHKVFGEAMAILAGDGLLSLAFEVMAEAVNNAETDLAAKALGIIASAASVNGMIGGQTVDILSEGRAPDKKTLKYIHENKTGALFKAAVTAGITLAGGTVTNQIEDAAVKLGYIFQIRDDILDVTSTSEKMGKLIHSDDKSSKMTYVSLYGLSQAEIDYKELSDEIKSVFLEFTDNDSPIYELVEYIIGRDY